jgi:hypothetical protein
MTKNGLDIQTISTKRIDFQADRVLLLGQLTEKKEKDNPSHFLKFLFADPHCTHLVLPDTQADPSQNQKSAIFAIAPLSIKRTLTSNKNLICSGQTLTHNYIQPQIFIS